MATVPSESDQIAATPAATMMALPHWRERFNRLSNHQKLGLILAAASVIALLVGGWLWTQTPDYRALYSNISEQDGAEIVNVLQQLNIPYKLSERGGVILVPEKHVHEVRLRLAGQGLPKGGLVGFELMENQKFGSSQFLEQVNYQRALEGELARSVQSLSAVQSARVHLAMAKPTVFSREKQQPSVSVLVNLYPGRVLGVDQVSAIVHLISSSVPNLPPKNVTVVDQNGNLLSSQTEKKEDPRFDAKQLEFIKEVEENYIRRIEAILAPITGAANVRAQVTAEVDFSRIERAEEMYRPNNTETEGASIRSQQTHESLATGSKLDGGIPGALTNRPPEPAIAPIDVPNKKPDGEDEEAPKAPPVPTEKKKESTINYEVDKTVQHTQQATGNIKRLSAAVVINFRKKVEENGGVNYEPLTAKEIKSINNLVKQAMGYNVKRGDTLTVTNSLFSDGGELEAPFWKDPDVLMLARELGKQLLVISVVIFFMLKVLKPFLISLTAPPPVPELADREEAMAETPKLTGVLPDGTPVIAAEGVTPLYGPDGKPLLGVDGAPMLVPQGTVIMPDGTMVAPDGKQLVTADGMPLVVPEGARIPEAGEMRVAALQLPEESVYEKNLRFARQLASEQPIIAATILKEWIAGDESEEGFRKTAILLMTLGEHEAASVIRMWGPKEVQRLGETMSSIQNVPRVEIEEIVAQFCQDSEGRTTLGQDSADYIRKVLTNALGDEKAANLLDRILHGGDTSGIEGLKWMDASSVADLIKAEHPQIIASILVHLERDHASEILTHFTERLRNDTLLRIATLESIQPEALRELNDVLKKLLSGSSSIRKAALGGVRTAAEILNFVPSAMETSVIENIKQHDEDLAQKIMDEMFVFDNLIELDNHAIQLLLREVQSDSLIIALKGAQEDLRNKIFSNMSQRAAEALREDLESKGPVRISEMETEQKEILKIVRKLADDGQIVLGGKGDDGFV